MGITLEAPPATSSTALFTFYGTLLGLFVDILVYPAELVKTTLQVSREVRI